MYVEYEHKPHFYITKNEFIHIFIAWIILSLTFAWILSNPLTNSFSMYLTVLPPVLVATLTGFVVHELAHKFMAIRYGAFAEFVIWPVGIILAIVTAMIGFIFAAPGAVYIYKSHLSIKENGIISVAGPALNLAMGLIFIGISFLYPSMWILFIAKINIFLGLFNMLPIPPLDGSKVLRWSPMIWGATGALLLILFLFV